MRKAGPLIGLVAATATAQGIIAPRGVTRTELDSMLSAAVQSEEVTLDASGNATWAFKPAFPIVPAVVHMPRAMDAANPIVCNFTAITASAVSIHCWRSAPVTVSLLGAIVNPFLGTIGGAKVNLVARYIP